MDERSPDALVNKEDIGSALPVSIPSAPSGIGPALAELLKHPLWAITRLESGGPILPSLRLLTGGAVCFVAYGAAAGFFQGGAQVGLAAMKAPLIVLASLLLCAPSFFVFGSLAGADLSGRQVAGLLSAFGGMLGVLLLGLLPIAWLFSFSTSSLIFATWLHVLAWAIALWFGWRFFTLAFPRAPARNVAFLWTVLFTVVSFQMATILRPVLYRAPGTPVVETGKLFFLEHLGSLKSPEPPKK
ncbi:MAG TPA: hypothetical protein VLJ18_12055 [Thermoanaerobaculia bacterium]|nr:hypothetical protein [Thermoanaerobaculia bacterium]